MLHNGPLNGALYAHLLCIKLVNSHHYYSDIISVIVGTVSLVIPYQTAKSKPPSCSLFSNILNDHIPFSGTRLAA